MKGSSPCKPILTCYLRSSGDEPLLACDQLFDKNSQVPKSRKAASPTKTA